MKKHLTHVIDEQAIEIFKAAFPKDAWTIYDIRPDYGKDHQVELVEDGDHTGKSFWVQVKGQKKVSKLRDGSISFKLETKDLEYQLRLPVPMFLIVIDVTKGIGYWVLTQQYEKTALRNVNWRGQDHIQIRLPQANSLSDLARLRGAVGDAIKYVTGSAFHADIHSEKLALESRDPRFSVEIQVGSEGRHYRIHSDEPIPVEFSYKDGDPSSGKIEDMIDRGRPITFLPGEIEVKGSPLFETFFNPAEGQEIRLEFNRTVVGHVHLTKSAASGTLLGRLDAIPCTIRYGRQEAYIDARLPGDFVAINLTIGGNGQIPGPLSMPLDLSAWAGSRLLELPHFDALTGMFGEYQPGEQFGLSCYVPGQCVLSGRFWFPDEKPSLGIISMLTTLRKAREIAVLKGINPKLPEEFGTRRARMEVVHEMIVGEGSSRRTPHARVTTTVTRGGLRKFLNDVKQPLTLGTLNLSGDGGFPFLGETVVVDPLERVVTEMRLVERLDSLRDQMRRCPNKRSFQLVWEGTEATKTTLRAGQKIPPDASESLPGKMG